MLFVDNQNVTDPRQNLALEEYLLRQPIAEPVLLFYINEPSVIIGRNQNTLAEIDPDYVAANGVHVVRRLSGGGAVYHDLGNLNFSFITPGAGDLHNFARFIEPVVAVLQDLGVAAELRGASDIFVDDKKISGNAQYASGGRMFSHGTLLFDTDLAAMLRALNPRQVHIESRAVQSIRNFVTNIRDLLPVDMPITGLRDVLLAGIFGGRTPPRYELDAAAHAGVAALRAERYDQWAWNYGRSPKFNVHKQERLAIGKLEARIDVDGGLIQALQLNGDFAGDRPVAELEAMLVGCRYDAAALSAALADVDVRRYLGGLTAAELAAFLY